MFGLLGVQLESVERGNGYDGERRIATITNVDDVNTLLRSPGLTSQRADVARDAFIAGPESDAGLIASFFTSWPVFSEGVYHELLRRELGRGLRASVGDGLAQSISDAASAHIDALTTDAIHDWIADVARPLSATLVRLLLPMDGDVVDRTIALSQVIMDSLALPKMDTDAAAAAVTAGQRLATLVESDLMQGDGPLSRALRRLFDMPECRLAGATGALVQVVTGALDPVVAAVGALPVVISAGPGARPAAAWREEILRLSSPFRLAARVATEAISVGDVAIRPGDRVVLQLGAANLDPTGYAEPTCPAVRARSEKHLAFGAGAHYCPGAPIVRAALDGVLAALKTRHSWFDVRRVEYRPGTFLRFGRVEGQLAGGDRVA
jgi:cytochrome P450